MQLLYQGMLWRAEDWAVSHNYGVCATCPFFLHQAMTLHRYRHDSLCSRPERLRRWAEVVQMFYKCFALTRVKKMQIFGE